MNMTECFLNLLAKENLKTHDDYWGSETWNKREKLFFDICKSLGWDPDDDQEFQEYTNKATHGEMYEYAILKVRDLAVI